MRLDICELRLLHCVELPLLEIPLPIPLTGREDYRTMGVGKHRLVRPHHARIGDRHGGLRLAVLYGAEARSLIDLCSLSRNASG
ncbi:hypothetical protein BGLA2_1050017 [Burkholderia gladioli]|nr:hypothetical protein BGLA2_1050017 [Burkholderia gladioli]